MAYGLGFRVYGLGFRVCLAGGGLGAAEACGEERVRGGARALW